MFRFSGALAALGVALTLGLPAPAQADQENCQRNLLRQVEREVRFIDRSLDVAQLSCKGLTQVYLILQDDERTILQPTRFRQRSAIRQVFRREGLL